MSSTKVEVKGKMILSLSKIFAPEPRAPPPTSLTDLDHHTNLVTN
ncbi:hypothetical protein D1BOALGB6SA_10708 [Olavius sp. associated proteobacterium Delta 1]|nr:hypothetical protein D1BOALGB6SA_10708 [Olavius sp. associated proteobacterium Delta 1]